MLRSGSCLLQSMTLGKSSFLPLQVCSLLSQVLGGFSPRSGYLLQSTSLGSGLPLSLHPDLLHHLSTSISCLLSRSSQFICKSKALPQNLFPSFGTQPGRFFSPARLMHLQGPGRISVPHHSAVRGLPYSCRTLWGVHTPGVIPHNDEALFEPDVSSLFLLTSSPLALPSISPPSPISAYPASFLLSLTQCIGSVADPGSLCLCPTSSLQKPSVCLCIETPAPSCLSHIPWPSTPRLVSAFNMVLMWYEPKSLTSHKTEGETKASQIFRHRSLIRPLHFSQLFSSTNTPLLFLCPPLQSFVPCKELGCLHCSFLVLLPWAAFRWGLAQS